jgi:multicomponent Na+:H+ antiporter subunit B
MSRRARFLVFVTGAGCVAAMLALAFFRMPAFGGTAHLYRDLAVPAAVAHRTANVVSSVNFDQRGLDTFGERTPSDAGRTLESTKLAGYLLLPVTLIVGFDVVVHGHVTPGGGFQGGVVLATGLHLLYVAGSYRTLDKMRPMGLYDSGEALGAWAFGALGLAGIAAAGAFLANIIPGGSFGQLLSAGTVPVLNIAVGLEVACGTVVLLANFLQQDIVVTAGRR